MARLPFFVFLRSLCTLQNILGLRRDNLFFLYFENQRFEVDERHHKAFSQKLQGIFVPEVESSRTSLASRTSSRTDFEVLGLGLEGQVLGLGLEASSRRKLACPRLEDSTILELVKFCEALEKFFGKRFFVEIA